LAERESDGEDFDEDGVHRGTFVMATTRGRSIGHPNATRRRTRPLIKSQFGGFAERDC
jgi:hypothetical protein